MATYGMRDGVSLVDTRRCSRSCWMLASSKKTVFTVQMHIVSALHFAPVNFMFVHAKNEERGRRG